MRSCLAHAMMPSLSFQTNCSEVMTDHNFGNTEVARVGLKSCYRVSEGIIGFGRQHRIY